MKRILYLTVFIWISITSVFSQEKKIEDGDWVFESNDQILWNGIRYCCNKSPISYFKGYVTIYKRDCLVDRMAPYIDDKGYEITWFISDSCLYLCDVQKLCDSSNDINQNISRFGTMEQLTGEKMIKPRLDLPDYINSNISQSGVMFAKWFSDTIYIKSFHSIKDYYNSKEPFTRLTFKKGKLINVLRTFKIPEKLKLKKRDIWEGISNENPAAQNLKPTNPRGFKGNTNDILYEGFSCKMMCSKSPAASLKDYDKFMGAKLECKRKIMLPIKDDKAYEFLWRVVKDQLYLCDVHFICGSDTVLNHDERRFSELEKLTGQKMVDVPYDEVDYKKYENEDYFNKRAIPATWFSDTLYVKLYILPYGGYYGSRLERSAIFRSVFKNGKIIKRDYVKEMP